MRATEALNLDKDMAGKRVIEIIGKGKKPRKIYFNQEAIYWIKKYLKARDDDCRALFVTHCLAKRLALRTIEGNFEQHFKTLHIDKHITLHTMRHTYGTNLLRNGCQADYIRRLMGHSKLETTRIYYLSVSQKDVEMAHFKYLNYYK
jgi:integrase/recombinase XerD